MRTTPSVPLLSTLAVAAGLACAGPARVEAGEPRVVLVTIDGLAAYHLADETLALPNLRALMAEGVRTESSQTVFPSVTHPSHTSIVTGVSPRVHGVIGNTVRNRETGERYHITNRPHAESVRVPTIFDAAKAAGLGTASFFWPENRDDPALDRSIPEVFTEESVADPEKETMADPAAADPAYLAELRAAGIPIDLFYDTYARPVLDTAGDVALAMTAAYEIRTRRPQLLAIHFVSSDAAQHWYGPQHELARAAIANADACVGLLREAVEAAGLASDTTFVVAADHGFHSVEHAVNLYPVFRDAGLVGKVALHGGGWTLFVETLDGFDADRDGPALDAAFAAALAVEGVSRVVRPEGFHDLGFPRYEENPLVPGQYMVIPGIDTFLSGRETDDPTAVRRRLPEPRHSHGYLPEHPRMYPGLILAGRGIRSGVAIGHVHNLDIAPTIAHLLGLKMEGLEGRVLVEALTPE